MDEILKKLLESDVLSEETKAEISTKFKASVDAFLAEERSKLEVEVRSQLTEEFVKVREELAASVDQKVNDFLKNEFDELKEDINAYRDLEVEYAEKLVEEKEVLAQQLGEQLNQLVDSLNAFLETTIDAEMSELKEDIEQVKKLEFGRKIFETFETEFKKFRKADLDTVEQDLSEALDKLADAEARIQKMENDRLAEARSAKMEELLSPLTGVAREQMKVILNNVANEKLDEAYKTYIGRVLRESAPKQPAVPTASTEAPITESKTEATTLVTGNVTEQTEEEPAKPNAQLSRIKALAGLVASR